MNYIETTHPLGVRLSNSILLKIPTKCSVAEIYVIILYIRKILSLFPYRGYLDLTRI